jgi:hypothetical protein
MDITNTRDIISVRNADLADSRFSDAKLTKAHFNDVNLQGSTFTKTNLGGARLVDVNLAGVTIQDANLTGMTINGILVTDLIRAFENRAQMVLYAKHLASMQAFYQSVVVLKVEHAEPDHAVLASSVSKLIIVQVPESIASTIHIGVPPERRTETPIKLVFEVESIAAARDMALRLGGQVDPVEREWIYCGRRVCDGHDPEGNVVQFQQRGSEQPVP